MPLKLRKLTVFPDVIETNVFSPHFTSESAIESLKDDSLDRN